MSDILYRVLVGRPASRREQKQLRERALQGTPPMELAHELKASTEGSRTTVHAIVPALRTYLRPRFDASAGEVTLPRLVFLHFMKVGGTSLCDIFVRWFGEERAAVHMFVDDIALTPAPVLATQRVIAGHIPFAALELIPPPYRTLAVLRDPFDRTLSHYSSLKSDNPLYEDLTLERFVFDDSFQWLSGNYQARQLAHDIDLTNAWRTYSPEHRLAAHGGDPTTGKPLAMLFDSAPIEQPEDDLLRSASANLAQIDFVGVTDRLDDIADKVADLFGFPASPAPRLNASPPLDRRDIDAKTRRRIDQRTMVDRELYELARERAVSNRG